MLLAEQPQQNLNAIRSALAQTVRLRFANGYGVSVRTLFTQDLPFVQGDRVQVQQVMLNLIINAICKRLRAVAAI